MTTFAYLRVSTIEQTFESQKHEIESKGITVDYYFSESISGAIQATQRPEFMKMLDKMRDGETLVVSKLDRLGRDSIDVQSTLKMLTDRGIKVRVLNLGEIDVTTPFGNLAVQMLAAVAELERTLIRERTEAGRQRAKKEGVKFGRKKALTNTQLLKMRELLKEGVSKSIVAKELGVSRATIYNNL